MMHLHVLACNSECRRPCFPSTVQFVKNGEKFFGLRARQRRLVLGQPFNEPNKFEASKSGRHPNGGVWASGRDLGNPFAVVIMPMCDDNALDDVSCSQP